MKTFLKLKRSWRAIRWKMLIIFGFFSIISMILMGCLAIAILNVVIRRESAYLLEERIKVAVDERKELLDSVEASIHSCDAFQSNALQLVSQSDSVWPENQVTVLAVQESGSVEHAMGDASSFDGVVADQGQLEIRSFRRVELAGCPVMLATRCELKVVEVIV